MKGPIGIFDSGFGGLTVLNDIVRRLPQYEYVYLGDNARAPYGTRSYEMVYRFTLQAVQYLFDCGCPLVILACNTASAKALRTIQQKDLPRMDDSTRRVLGVIRPTAEVVNRFTRTGHVGVIATPGTIASRSYDIEIQHLHPDIVTTGQPCPMWVPIIENNQIDTPGAEYFIKNDLDRLMERDPRIDTVVLGCTHYPIIEDRIKKHLPEGVVTISQGRIVADSLEDYLHRHPEMEWRLSRATSPEAGIPDRQPELESVEYLTTDDPERFDAFARTIMGRDIKARQISLS